MTADNLESSESNDVKLASERQLVWARFRKHKLALISAVIVAFFYLVAFGAEFVAVNDPVETDAKRSLMPPQSIHVFDGLKPAPYVCAMIGKRDPVSLKKTFDEDCSEKIPMQFFARGFEYKFLGLLHSNRHLIGVGDSTRSHESLVFPLGTDVQGRGLFSRIVYGTRFSLSIGLVGVTLTLILGVSLGAISGYFGGVIDTVIQRSVEIFRAIPTIPIWLVLAGILPRDWGVLQIYFAITIIISLFAWTDLARVVRGKFLSLREEDFVTAAMLSGGGWQRIVFRHMLPSFYSHLIAATTLAIPSMIISETALSFLGLGLRSPAISWGVLLHATQNVHSIALTPWLMLPALPVIVVILALNFMGDGLRDAADPYSSTS